MTNVDCGWWVLPDHKRALLCWHCRSGELVLHRPDGRTNDLLAVIYSEAELRRRLDGWEHHCFTGNGLAWLAGQLEGCR
jgi:hypothetical protein